MLTGHGFLTPTELEQALRQRGITDAEIDRAEVVVSAPDPAGVVPDLRREDIAEVAVYLHVESTGVWLPSPAWILMQRGHPATKAIYWHERQELAAYEQLGVLSPLEVDRSSATFWTSHAWACWAESCYWQAWANAEGSSISATAFLHGHPLRGADPRELQDVLGYLGSVWGVTPAMPPVIEFDQAVRFYRSKQLTPAGIRQWCTP